MKYHEQIKHPMWQKKRLEVLETAGFKCLCCGAVDEELHVHHPHYKRGAMIWEYENYELQVLCHKCHKDEHALDELIKSQIAYLPRSVKVKVLGYVDASNGAEPRIDSKEYRKGYIDEFRDCDEVLMYFVERNNEYARHLAKQRG